MKTIKSLIILSMLLSQGITAVQTPERYKECDEVRAALIASCKSSSKPAADVLEKFPKCGQEDSEHRRNVNDTPLLYQVISGGADAVNAVLDSGADIEEKNSRLNDETALHTSSGYGNVDVVQALLARGANPNATDRTSWTPAHDAALFGHLSVLQALHQGGADLTVKDENGKTPLHYSLDSSCLAAQSITKYLIDQKIDLDTTNRYGKTALQNAVDDVILYKNNPKTQSEMDTRRATIRLVALAGADYSAFTDAQKAELFEIAPELKDQQEKKLVPVSMFAAMFKGWF